MWCDHRCPERIATRKQVETMAVYLLQQGAYLSEMRVSRKSQVHVACEVFVLGRSLIDGWIGGWVGKINGWTGG